MKDYNNYNLDDFLLDENFKELIITNEDPENKIWNEIAFHFPDKIAVMQQAREIILALGDHNSNFSHQELEQEVSRILESTSVSKKGKSFIFPLQWFSVAATILIVLGIGWEINRSFNQPQSTKFYEQYISTVAKPMQEVVNETTQPMLLKLPDGSQVRLTPESRISYTKTFIHNNKREVYLSGEAFFEVEKDAKNPFFVYANGLLTRVVGTSFLIKAMDADVEVVVRTGRVTVLPIKDMDNQDDKNTELVLTPNQQALFSTRDNLISKSIVNLPVEITKEEILPDFTFENMPISDVFSLLEKTYGIPIIYDEAVMHQCSLRVALSNEPFFTKLDIICKTVGAEYQVRDGQIIISSEGCE